MAGKYLSLLVHFTWSTAGREPWIETEMRDDLYSYIGGIMKNKNAKLIATGGMFDHIHLYALHTTNATFGNEPSLAHLRRSNFVGFCHALTGVAIKFRPFGPTSRAIQIE
jgi:hypothetical protein